MHPQACTVSLATLCTIQILEHLHILMLNFDAVCFQNIRPTVVFVHGESITLTVEQLDLSLNAALHRM